MNVYQRAISACDPQLFWSRCVIQSHQFVNRIIDVLFCIVLAEGKPDHCSFKIIIQCM